MAKKKGNKKKAPQAKAGRKGGSREAVEMDLGQPQPARKKKK